jgi:hypothetical protein
MNDLTRSIRESTGLSIKEFCDLYLESDFRTFAHRRRSNTMHPNEALLICLITGKNPGELFGYSTLDLFFTKGKSEKVSKKIKEILASPEAFSKLSLILSNPDGLRIKLTDQQPPAPQPKRQAKSQRQPVAVKPQEPKKPITSAEWMEENPFR